MLKAAFNVGKPSTSTSTTRNSFIAFYSTVSGLTRRNWGTRGPKPISLLNSEVPEYEEPSENPRTRRPKPGSKPTPAQFATHRKTLKEAFPEGWNPPRKLSRDAMQGLRALHHHDPETFSTAVLAEKFKISPEAVRRILKSKWQPSKEQIARLLARERQNLAEYISQKRKEETKQQIELLGKREERRGKAYGIRNKDDGFSLT
ncbi:Required for respiratory growth protein 9, mitochondrial [Abortiporus biennis]